jgi:hypothetical protein
VLESNVADLVFFGGEAKKCGSSTGSGSNSFNQHFKKKKQENRTTQKKIQL